MSSQIFSKKKKHRKFSCENSDIEYSISSHKPKIQIHLKARSYFIHKEEEYPDKRFPKENKKRKKA